MKFRLKKVFTSTPTYNANGSTNGNTIALVYQLLDKDGKLLGSFHSRDAVRDAAEYVAGADKNTEDFEV